MPLLLFASLLLIIFAQIGLQYVEVDYRGAGGMYPLQKIGAEELARYFTGLKLTVISDVMLLLAHFLKRVRTASIVASICTVISLLIYGNSFLGFVLPHEYQDAYLIFGADFLVLAGCALAGVLISVYASTRGCIRR